MSELTAAGTRSPLPSASIREVEIPSKGTSLPGLLAVPPEPRGVVAFAHGSGSSRSSRRNLAVAAALTEAGLGTLLFDLLTAGEELDRRNVFDIPLLASRLVAATSWLETEPELYALPLGYFGASTGAAAALCAAADYPHAAAVVSRGGRPDLAAAQLPEVCAPTLLIVGGSDEVVLELNRSSLELLPHGSELRVVPGATHLFEEPGALEEVSRVARGWFLRHFTEADDAR